MTSPLDQQILRRSVFVPLFKADYYRLVRRSGGISTIVSANFPEADFWLPSLTVVLGHNFPLALIQWESRRVHLPDSDPRPLNTMFTERLPQCSGAGTTKSCQRWRMPRCGATASWAANCVAIRPLRSNLDEVELHNRKSVICRAIQTPKAHRIKR